MAKRRVFHVSTNVFGSGLSSTAISIYSYLSFCSDRTGKCFPSVKTMARECSISENTVRKAIRELVAANFISVKESYSKCKCGMRQGANIYQILSYTTSGNEREPVQQIQRVGSQIEGEINNNRKDITETPSVGHNEALEGLIDSLELYAYEDMHFSKAIELCIRDMYFKEHITVGGERIEQFRIRERLSHLDTSCIDHIYSRMRDYGANFSNAGGYLASCIYNAPIDFNTDLAAFGAAL